MQILSMSVISVPSFSLCEKLLVNKLAILYQSEPEFEADIIMSDINFYAPTMKWWKGI